MKRLLALTFWMAAALVPVSGWGAATYAMKVTPSMPKGSAGEKLATSQPTNTKLSPCSSSTQVDAVTFTLAYNAGSGPDLLDVYMLFFNPGADGIFDPHYYIVSKTALSTGGLALVPRYTLSEVNPATDMYLAKEANPGSSVTETLLSSFITVDGVPAGTWQLVGIMGDRATINFDNPSTWAAWDVATVMLRKPWPGSSNSYCQ